MFDIINKYIIIVFLYSTSDHAKLHHFEGHLLSLSSMNGSILFTFYLFLIFKIQFITLVWHVHEFRAIYAVIKCRNVVKHKYVADNLPVVAI